MAFDFPANPTLDQVYIQGDSVFLWNGYAWMFSANKTAAAGDYVLKAGDVMTGALTLPADPTLALQAATKQYVDAVLANLARGQPGQALVMGGPTPQWGATIDSANF
jgi:hypothetical protein